MRRYKILGGIMILLLLVVAVSKAITPEAEPIKSSVISPAQLLAEQKRVKDYHVRQQKLRKAIANYFDRAIKAGDIVGAGISIVKGDSILISGGYGKRKNDEKSKVDEKTIFRLGSLSKGFAGVLAASVKAEGKLDWNDKVTEYIPEFQLGDSANTDKIHISHILSHSSGAPYHSFTNLIEADIPVAKIASRFHEVKPQSEPGMQYSYQNAMFALIQEVILNSTGQKVKTTLQNRFFAPLDMSTVSMNHETITKSKNVALPHAKGRKGWRSLPLKNRYYNAVVAGGIDASSLDMAKWMRFLLGHNPEVMSKKAIQEVFKPIIALKDNNKYYQRWPGHVQSSYGFGWRLHTFKDVETQEDFTIWHHGGSVNNYRNEIAIFPDADLGICVLLNGNSKLARTVIPDLHAIVKDHLNLSVQNL